MSLSTSATKYFFDIISGRRKTPEAVLFRALLTVPAYCFWLPLSMVDKRWKLRRRCRLECPVISVGNLTAGGTGKTPMVEWLCRVIRCAGFRPAILTNDYRSGKESGNEETRLLSGRFHDVPVLAGKKRSELARAALRENRADCFLLDDGFQHLALERDLDIVLIDCLLPFGYGHPLPRGLLREPLSSLKRSDIVVLTRSDQVSDEVKQSIYKRLKSENPDLPVVESVHEPLEIFEANAGGKTLPLSELDGMRVMLFSALGNPAGFEATVKSLGGIIPHHIIFRDHHHYTDADLGKLARKAGKADCRAVLTTEKDYMKIGEKWTGNPPLYVLKVEWKMKSGEQFLLNKLKSALSANIQ